MKRKILFTLSVLGALMLTGAYLHVPSAAADEDQGEESQTRWETRAEKSFGIGPGLGRRLMTEEEWREHQRKMQSMTAEEKAEYRKEVHEKLRERAKEKGITMPDEPGPHHMMDRPGKGMGRGMGGGKGRY